MDLEDISGDECLKRYMAATERPLGVLPRLSVTDTQGVVVWQIPPGELYCRFKVNDDPDAHMGGLCAAEVSLYNLTATGLLNLRRPSTKLHPTCETIADCNTRMPSSPKVA